MRPRFYAFLELQCLYGYLIRDKYGFGDLEGDIVLANGLLAVMGHFGSRLAQKWEDIKIRIFWALSFYFEFMLKYAETCGYKSRISENGDGRMRNSDMVTFHD